MQVKKTKTQAMKAATSLSIKLDKAFRGNWKPNAWQNMGGWCWDVTCGSIQVSQYQNKDESFYYSALLNGEKGEAGGGLGIWTPKEHNADTPEEAVLIVARAAQECIDNLQVTLDANYKFAPQLKPKM